jgi:hypothetical protein
MQQSCILCTYIHSGNAALHWVISYMRRNNRLCVQITVKLEAPLSTNCKDIYITTALRHGFKQRKLPVFCYNLSSEIHELNQIHSSIKSDIK